MVAITVESETQEHFLSTLETCSFPSDAFQTTKKGKPDENR